MKDRFKHLYSQGTMGGFQIWEDTVTHVNYLLHDNAGHVSAMTVLLDKDGKPVITQPK